MYTSDVNDAEPRLSFSEKTSQSRDKTYKTLQSRNYAFLKLHLITNFIYFTFTSI